jgi:hypothetical protein
MTKADTWELLMDNTIRAHYEQDDFTPGMGNNTTPGSDPSGSDPMGIRYADLGPLAVILNEAMDTAIHSGSDRDSLLDEISEKCGPTATANDLEAVLAGDVVCPPPAVLTAFATQLAIDLPLVEDAAARGGCTDYKTMGRPAPAGTTIPDPA